MLNDDLKPNFSPELCNKFIFPVANPVVQHGSADYPKVNDLVHASSSAMVNDEHK